MKNIFDPQLEEILLNKIGIARINEIRFRIDKPILVFIGNASYYISSDGITNEISQAVTATKQMIENIIFRASECSIYAVNEQMKRGFLSIEGGIRIGICGTVVNENGNIKTIKDFTSINIRIPHEIKNCSLNAFYHLVENGNVKNTLIISPPGAGKTTFLRDFVYQLSKRNFVHNILILDERGEIAGSNGCLNIGDFSDVLSFSSKKMGFEQGIRSMNPDIIVVDELMGEEDLEAVIHASSCGVKVIASAHAKDLKELKKKAGFNRLLLEKCFERFVVLSKQNGLGTYEGVFGENFERIAFYSS